MSIGKIALHRGQLVDDRRFASSSSSALASFSSAVSKPLSEPAQIPAKSGTSAMVAQVLLFHSD
jgi:hypothetical protein